MHVNVVYFPHFICPFQVAVVCLSCVRPMLQTARASCCCYTRLFSSYRWVSLLWQPMACVNSEASPGVAQKQNAAQMKAFACGYIGRIA